jgi:hypothetical protein
MPYRALDASGNDFALLEPIVGRDTSEAFVKFFRAQQQLAALGHYTDEELRRFSVARKYQLAQQCLYLAAAREKEALELVRRLGPEYEAWFRYMTERKKSYGLPAHV